MFIFLLGQPEFIVVQLDNKNGLYFSCIISFPHTTALRDSATASPPFWVSLREAKQLAQVSQLFDLNGS